MKEKIIIKNFSVLDDVEIDVSRINILIGPQSTGKSLISKLVYFFRSISHDMHFAIISDQDKGRKEKNGLKKMMGFKFNNIFPDYILRRKSFEVEYSYGDNFISISNKKGKDFHSLKILFSSAIEEKFDFLKKEYDKEKKDPKFNDYSYKQNVELSLYNQLSQLFYGSIVYQNFIPAGRSFFANIEKNIFSLLQHQTSPMDQILMGFGSLLSNIRDRHLYTKKQLSSRDLYNRCVEVLGGEYEFDGQHEWIITREGQKISLRNASSGQQELIPLLLMLQEFSTYLFNSFVFIEEPELHLFPKAQRDVVEIIAMVYNHLKRNSGFFITTHSPYILTSFNNLIQAENTERSIREREPDEKTKSALLGQLDEIVAPDKRVSIDDVSVYLIKDGKATDIKDRETNLINADAIDDVSDSLASTFDRLLNLIPEN